MWILLEVGTTSLGLKCPQGVGIPQPQCVFNMYRLDSTLNCIFVETNRYAHAELPQKETNPPRTKRAPKWVDVNRADIRGWIGIYILMGCKRLPIVRHYWMRSEPFMCFHVTFEVMTLARWKQILCCLHLIDNTKVV